MATILRRGRTRAGLALLAVGLHGLGMTGLLAGTAMAVSDPVGTLTLMTAANGAVDVTWRVGDPALYVVEQPGRVIRAADGTTTPVLDISGEISAGGEQGLLGLAFDPAGALAYVNYTDSDGDTVIERFAVGADGVFDVASREVIMTIDQPYDNHNGGDLTFGPDGMLYIGMGDGGAGGDPERRALNLGELLGKLLRIDPSAPSTAADGTALAYTIPADNPFVDVEGARGEIWSIGLRNPWRFSFDSETGDLWIADVGQNAVEEVDVVAAADGVNAGRGASFGWSAFEGDQPYNSDVTAEGAIAPIAVYGHDSGRCSVSGGVRARGAANGALDGWYVFGDYCSGEVFALEPSADLTESRTLTVAQGQNITAVVSGPNGEVLVVDASGVSQLTA
jgi:glucose/arabinose dehydrogenase